MTQTPSSRQQIFGVAALLITAVIWGLAFVAQRNGMDHVGPCYFNALRSFLGAVALMPVIGVLDAIGGRRVSLWGAAENRSQRRSLLVGGVACGVMLGLASVSQQWGIVHSTVGKAGFLTTLYIIIVPIAGLFLGRRVTSLMWVAAALAIGGMYLLCMSGDRSLDIGDVLLILCAVLFSAQIMCIDYFAPGNDCVRMSCIQFFTAGVVSVIAGLIFRENISWQGACAAWKPILYCGLLSSGVGYTLQMVAQKSVHPVTASLLMSLESVFSLLGGALLLGERLNGRQLLGCGVIFCGVILAQIPVKPQNTPADDKQNTPPAPSDIAEK